MEPDHFALVVFNAIIGNQVIVRGPPVGGRLRYCMPRAAGCGGCFASLPALFLLCVLYIPIFPTFHPRSNVLGGGAWLPTPSFLAFPLSSNTRRHSRCSFSHLSRWLLIPLPYPTPHPTLPPASSSSPAHCPAACRHLHPARVGELAARPLLRDTAQPARVPCKLRVQLLGASTIPLHLLLPLPPTVSSPPPPLPEPPIFVGACICCSGGKGMAFCELGFCWCCPTAVRPASHRC